ncbi:ciliary basal body-associated, B9 protein-domain-containing protein [Zopfochytrium polystomum]|nr:ciliary basal body-associated, B9 protein-domain-containing protein [Zopfochytrium polystomum]
MEDLRQVLPKGPSRTTSRRAHVPTTFLSPPSALPNALRLTLFGTIHTARSFRSPCARLYIHYLVDFDDAAWSSGSVIDVIVGPSSSSSSSASPTAAAAAESPSSPFSPATEDAKSSTTAAGFGIPHRWMRRLMNGGAGAANPLQPNCVVRKRQDLLAAYTQCSTCTFNEDADAWEARFGLPIEVELTTMRNGSRLKWPRLYVEVCSMDSWDRHVVEGYSYVEIPRTAGCFNLELPTWRPVTTPAADMKSMLIGGSSELEDITYGAIPNGHKGSKLIKYGFQCETSGMVELSLNVVLQSSDLRKPKERGGGGPEKRDVDPTAYLKENASSISDALSRARARMQSLRSREDYTSSRDDSRNGSF